MTSSLTLNGLLLSLSQDHPHTFVFQLNCVHLPCTLCEGSGGIPSKYKLIHIYYRISQFISIRSNSFSIQIIRRIISWKEQQYKTFFYIYLNFSKVQIKNVAHFYSRPLSSQHSSLSRPSNEPWQINSILNGKEFPVKIKTWYDSK